MSLAFQLPETIFACSETEMPNALLTQLAWRTGMNNDLQQTVAISPQTDVPKLEPKSKLDGEKTSFLNP